LPNYPDINVEISGDARLTDIVAERFDTGVRLGDSVAKDMIAVRIGPDMEIGVVGSPEYFGHYQKPNSPRELNSHRCINLRLPSYGGLYAWEFRHGEQEFRVRVSGQLVFNRIAPIAQAALRGLGLAYLPLEHIRTDLEDGNLVQVLKDWTPPFPGYHLYYPSRKHPTPAFNVVVDALRYRSQ
jgi:DNA-binding transcriptional LysR family regulator